MYISPPGAARYLSPNWSSIIASTWGSKPSGVAARTWQEAEIRLVRRIEKSSMMVSRVIRYSLEKVVVAVSIVT